MKIKNFITADDLERKAQESQAALDALKNKLDHYTTEFHEHIAGNLNSVEMECNRIKGVIEAVNDGNTQTSGMTSATVQMQFQALNARYEEVREHISEVKKNGGGDGINKAAIELIHRNMAQMNGQIHMIKEVTDKLAKGTFGTSPAEMASQTAACSSAQGERYRCENLELLKVKVADLERRVLQQAPVRDPPRGGDPWQYLQAQGGSPAPLAPQELFRTPPGFQQSVRRPLTVNQSIPEMKDDLNRLFDDKIAISAGFTYDGDKNGEGWTLKVRGYWIAKCPDILPILNYAEDLDSEELTVDMLQREARSCR